MNPGLTIEDTETLWPLLALTAFFVGALPVYARSVRKGNVPRDERIEKRRTGPFLGRYLMYYLLWVIGPIERLLVRRRVSPNFLTFCSLLLSAVSAAAIALGRFGIGGWLYLFTGIFDIFDGRVARATGRVSRAGAFYDSVVDRWAEAFIFGGLAFYYRHTWTLLLVLLAQTASFMISYARARGEGLGVKGADVGSMQRPERILYLGVGMALSPLFAAVIKESEPRHNWLGLTALGLVGIMSLGTALRRFWVIFKALQADAKPLDE